MTQASGMRRAEKRLPPPASLASARRHCRRKSAELEFGRPGGEMGRGYRRSDLLLALLASDAAPGRYLLPCRPGPKPDRPVGGSAQEAAKCFPGLLSPGGGGGEGRAC